MANIPAWVALGIALYGGGLATWNAWTARQERKDALRRDVRVKGTIRPHPADPVNRTRYLLIAANHARRPVQIVRAGVQVLNGPGIIFHGPATPGLPATLSDGESVTVEVPDDWIETFILEPYGHADRLVVEDSLGNVYFSELNPRSEADNESEQTESG